MKKIFKEDIEESLVELIKMWYTSFEISERERIESGKEHKEEVTMSIDENIVINLLNDNISHFLNFLNYTNDYARSQSLKAIYGIIIEKIYSIFGEDKKQGRPKDSVAWVRKNIPVPDSVVINYYPSVVITWEDWALSLNNQMKNEIV